MVITINQQLNYIDGVTVRYFKGELTKDNALFRIRSIMRLQPKLNGYGQTAINSIAENRA